VALSTNDSLSGGALLDDVALLATVETWLELISSSNPCSSPANADNII
jgi:hypothetical protein